MNEIEGLISNRGPALIAMKPCPQTVNETTSQSPLGVSRSVVTLVTCESGNTSL